MIDRDARDRLLAVVDDYMDGRIDAATFDGLFHDRVAPRTKDKLIATIRQELFYTYEAIGHDWLHTDCEYWKAFNRVRLMLASNAEYEIKTERHWNTRQLGAILMLFILASGFWMSWKAGEYALVIYAAVIYFLSFAIALALWFRKKESADSEGRLPLYAVYPFASFADLLAVWRHVPEFCSKRFRRQETHMPEKKSGDLTRLLSGILLTCFILAAIPLILPAAVLALPLVPLFLLLFRLFPDAHTEMRLKLPGEG